ncbi:MAG: GNAT family N-acetyltransferase [Gemmatimonadales bacterium]|nr:GNAT family N-acetyltransferase [Gemmatimonadales bacterium]
MGETNIREVTRDDEFRDWFEELLEREDASYDADAHAEERWLVASNAIGDWIGGVHYHLRGGVSHLLELAVAPAERHQGHAHELLAAFEEHSLEAGAHVVEFWTEDTRSLALLGALGWTPVLARPNYIGGRTWHLMEKRLDAA